MKKLSLLLTILIPIFCFCKRPETKKTNIEQKIETPAMQMAEPAQTIPAGSIDSTTAPIKSPDPTHASSSIVKPLTNIEIIIDASGSMNGLMGQNSKINALKNALKNVVNTPLPPEMSKRKIALRVYGSRSSSDKNDCSDTSLLAPMQQVDSKAFNVAIDQIKANGTTPIAFTLEEANKEFTESSEKADNLLVLIADGIESCGGDPIAAAARLHKGNSKVLIDVIGFDVDQTAVESLKKIAETASGHFYLARSDIELTTTLDQVLSSTLPYNLRVKAMSGASPLASKITVYRANTQSVIDRAEAPGIKFFKLQPGSYDIAVEYNSSVESSKPSKMVKGVEVQASTKTEQVVQFELGAINLSAQDQNGKETVGNFYFRKSGSEDIVARLMNAQTPQTVYLTPGKYDIDAETAVPDSIALTAQLKEIAVNIDETVEQKIKFQTGKLKISAQNVSKKPVPIKYRITKPGATDVLATGEGPAEGVIVDLPPGNYDVYVTWMDPNVQGAPEAKLSNVLINGGETLEQLTTIVTGTLKLSGKDGQLKPIPAEFLIKAAGSTGEAVKITSDGSPQEVFVSPGKYDVTAINTTSKIVPQPSLMWADIIVKEGQAHVLDAIFKLGTIKLIGKNAKQQSISTIFTIYRGGLDEPLVTETSERDWISFNLTPGLYDIKAEDAKAATDPKPATWFHDIDMKAGETLAKEAVFTSGKLKLICRGKNNSVLSCEFNVFTYGSDTALFSGTTSEEWKEFDIPPGKYYMEAGFHDPVEEQFLKKWINISIGENQIVEQILRF